MFDFGTRDIYLLKCPRCGHKDKFFTDVIDNFFNKCPNCNRYFYTNKQTVICLIEESELTTHDNLCMSQSLVRFNQNNEGASISWHQKIFDDLTELRDD